MIYRLEKTFMKIRRLLSRSEWLIRVLALEKQGETNSEHGLVIIQIDGLSHSQFQAALKHKRLPFLQTLLKDQHYHLHDLYSGTPSTTPAVQAELFYGVKTAVPAFSFKSQNSAEVVSMNRYKAAFDVEQRLKTQGEPLLKGGSSYSNIYRGGAREANFCSSSLGWSSVTHMANPFAIGIFILLNLYSFIRVLVLMLLEFVLAIVDFFRGIIARHDLFREIQFVPARVAVSLLLRELVTIGAKLDVARGLPIIHLNLLGYDEQSHRRGPSSKFAHWTLKGIDDAIRRIWRAAQSSALREYDVWIYSDHGQQETIPYARVHGITVEEAINRVFVSHIHHLAFVSNTQNSVFGIQYLRAKYIGGGRLQKLLSTHQGDHCSPVTMHENTKSLVVTAMGPMGSIYSAVALSSEKREEIAVALIKEANIPLVFVSLSASQVKVWNDNGEYLLPRDAPKIFGEQHPFLHQVTTDIIRLCQHPEAGDLMISGWSVDKPYITFAQENGSHGGPGPEETHAFALLPSDTALPVINSESLRPLDLYHSAQHKLVRKKLATQNNMLKKTDKTTSKSIRILTYNVHSCIGMDGKLSPQRIARIIAQYQPDVVALQELDVGRRRTGNVHQAKIISEYLAMEYHFHPAMHIEEERYGNAILTHLPVKLIKSGILPILPSKPWLEPRGVIWVAIEAYGQQFNLLNTHLGLRPAERAIQANALLGEEWLANAKCVGPVVICGDFNSLPNSAVHKRFSRHLNDLQVLLDDHRPKKTFGGRFPSARIDHIFGNSMVNVQHVEVPRTQLTRTSSDHLPLIVDIQLVMLD
jgi:endonuclease/exonuclease/phosphatase family metal-dependent hydrolase